MVIVSSLGAVGLSAVGTRKGGAVHLTGRLPAASLVVLVAHEAGEGSPAALGSGEGKQPERLGLGPHMRPTPAVRLTSWGQRSLPICFSTLRNRSRSSCSLPSEASASEGWGAGPALISPPPGPQSLPRGSGPPMPTVRHGDH